MKFLSPMIHRFSDARVRALFCLTVAGLLVACEAPAEKVVPADDTSAIVDTAVDAADTGADTADTGAGEVTEDTAPDGADTATTAHPRERPCARTVSATGTSSG